MTTASRKLGAFDVFPISLGCMGMSGMYGAADETESIATIHEAIDNGVNLLDTGDFYGMGHNEMLIGRAIRDRRDKVLLSVKFGALRGPDNAWLGIDTRPTSVKTFLAYTLKRLGVDFIDIYRPSRLDPSVPIEETIGARRRVQLRESLAALAVNLTPGELTQIERAIPPDAVAGSRYDENQMNALDSERG